MGKFKRVFSAGVAMLVAINVTASAKEIPKALEDAIRAEAAHYLHDPYSAVFTYDIVRDIDEVGGQVCGTVNAKNLYGGYTGAKFFMAGWIKPKDAFDVVTFSTIDASLETVLSAEPRLCR